MNEFVLQIHRHEKEGHIRRHRALLEAVKDRLLPAFASISNEADEVASRAFSEALRGASLEGPDESQLAEMAFEAGFDHWETLDFARDQMLRLAAAGTYHLWERTLKNLLLRELRHHGLAEANRTKIERATFSRLIEILRAGGYDVQSYTFGHDLNVLSLIANMVKHGAGSSSRALATLSPGLFPGITGFGPLSDPPTEDDFEMTLELLERSTVALEGFWANAPDAMRFPRHS